MIGHGHIVVDFAKLDHGLALLDFTQAEDMDNRTTLQLSVVVDTRQPFQTYVGGKKYLRR
jgi:hypothetical protein